MLLAAFFLALKLLLPVATTFATSTNIQSEPSILSKIPYGNSEYDDIWEKTLEHVFVERVAGQGGKVENRLLYLPPAGSAPLLELLDADLAHELAEQEYEGLSLKHIWSACLWSQYVLPLYHNEITLSTEERRNILTMIGADFVFAQVQNLGLLLNMLDENQKEDDYNSGKITLVYGEESSKIKKFFIDLELPINWDESRLKAPNPSEFIDENSKDNPLLPTVLRLAVQWRVKCTHLIQVFWEYYQGLYMNLDNNAGQFLNRETEVSPRDVHFTTSARKSMVVNVCDPDVTLSRKNWLDGRLEGKGTTMLYPKIVDDASIFGYGTFWPLEKCKVPYPTSETIGRGQKRSAEAFGLDAPEVKKRKTDNENIISDFPVIEAPSPDSIQTPAQSTAPSTQQQPTTEKCLVLTASQQDLYIRALAMSMLNPAVKDKILADAIAIRDSKRLQGNTPISQPRRAQTAQSAAAIQQRPPPPTLLGTIPSPNIISTPPPIAVPNRFQNPNMLAAAQSQHPLYAPSLASQIPQYPHPTGSYAQPSVQQLMYSQQQMLRQTMPQYQQPPHPTYPSAHQSYNATSTPHTIHPFQAANSNIQKSSNFQPNYHQHYQQNYSPAGNQQYPSHGRLGNSNPRRESGRLKEKKLLNSK